MELFYLKLTIFKIKINKLQIHLLGKNINNKLNKIWEEWEQITLVTQMIVTVIINIKVKVSKEMKVSLLGVIIVKKVYIHDLFLNKSIIN